MPFKEITHELLTNQNNKNFNNDTQQSPKKINNNQSEDISNYQKPNRFNNSYQSLKSRMNNNESKNNFIHDNNNLSENGKINRNSNMVKSIYSNPELINSTPDVVLNNKLLHCKIKYFKLILSK